MNDIITRVNSLKTLNNELEAQVLFELPFEYSCSEGLAVVSVDVRTPYFIVNQTCTGAEVAKVFAALDVAEKVIKQHIAYAKELNAYCQATNTKLLIEVSNMVTRETCPEQHSMKITAGLGDRLHTMTFWHHDVADGKLKMFLQWAIEIHRRNEEAKAPPVPPATASLSVD